ncbi:uncharacterized protein LOC117915757 [Vitis riparia]|uniref:uncharacterized protein LOC117915757 n=1 Tax=Vitis riparia TaxID=96939 RepID=UPI00155AB060|nr:uncharacterized protein LOC117915757 [Vitis riparia]
MDEDEFHRLFELFPIVRSRDYHADLESSRQSTSQSSQDGALKGQNSLDEGNGREIEIQGINLHDAFWEKLKVVAERKVGPVEAERFCKAFQQVHRKLVYEELSLEAARNFVNSSRSSKE